MKLDQFALSSASLVLHDFERMRQCFPDHTLKYLKNITLYLTVNSGACPVIREHNFKVDILIIFKTI